MAGLMFEGSELPESVRSAAQGASDYAKAIKNKISLAYEGSGVPESVRKAAQAALERGAKLNAISNGGYAEAVSKASPWLEGQSNISGEAVKDVLGKGASAIGKGARFLGGGIAPVMMGAEGVEMLNQKYGPAAYQNIQNAVEEGQTKRAIAADPALADRGLLAADKVSTQAMDGVRGLMAQGAEQNANAAPQPIPAGIAAPQGQAPAQAPQTPPQPQAPDPAQAAAAKAQKEVQRQTIEKGALHQLQTNQLSRTKAAEAVVQADFQRRGVEATPKEKQHLVAQEVASMRNMGNPELAKYLSWAMLAVGVGASLADKSGQAFNNFATSGMNAYSSAKQRQFAQAQLEREYQLKLAEQTRKNRNTDSEIDYRGDTTNLKRGDQELDREKFGYDKDYKNTRLDQYDRQLGQGDVRNGIAQQGVGIAQQRANQGQESLNIQRERLKLATAKDAAEIKKLQTIDVPDISQKDAVAATDGYLKDAGYKSSPGASATVADQYIRWRKKYPNVDSRTLMKKAAEQAGLKYDEGGWFSSDKAALDFDEDE